jgi:hypothetical protein
MSHATSPLPDCLTAEQRPIVDFICDTIAEEIIRARAQFMGQLASEEACEKAYRKY